MSGLAHMSGIWDLGPVWTDPQSKIYYSYHHSRLIEVYTNLSQTVSYNRHHLHWKIEGNGPRGPQTPGWWLRNTQISRKSLAVWFLAVKSPLFLIEYLLDGQLPHVLWHWHVSILSQKNIYILYIYIHIHIEGNNGGVTQLMNHAKGGNVAASCSISSFLVMCTGIY